MRSRLKDDQTIKDELPEDVSRKIINFLNDKSVELTGTYRKLWDHSSEIILTSKPYQVALNLMNKMKYFPRVLGIKLYNINNLNFQDLHLGWVHRF